MKEAEAGWNCELPAWSRGPGQIFLLPREPPGEPEDHPPAPEGIVWGLRPLQSSQGILNNKQPGRVCVAWPTKGPRGSPPLVRPQVTSCKGVKGGLRGPLLHPQPPGNIGTCIAAPKTRAPKPPQRKMLFQVCSGVTGQAGSLSC